MAYYLANSNTRFGRNGMDARLSILRRVGHYFLSIAGVWPKAWRTIDRIIGPFIFDFPTLRNYTRIYDHVTLVQTSSWGVQDRMLAWMGRKEKWRSVLLPYTTDQLFCNGYLMSNFDAVCVQGSAEDGFAQKFHKVPMSRIKHLGSAWFRHIDVIDHRIKHENKRQPDTDKKTIMIAGVSSTYYPLPRQYELIDHIINAMEDGSLNGIRLVLRPVVFDKKERQEFMMRYDGLNGVTIQSPQSVCIGLNDASTAHRGGIGEALAEYIGQLKELDLVVTIGMTSLSLDAGYLGIPSVAVFEDKEEVLKRRFTKTLLNSDQYQEVLRVLVLHRLDQLVPFIQLLLGNPEKSREIATRIASGWDYPDAKFNKILLEAVMCESC